MKHDDTKQRPALGVAGLIAVRFHGAAGSAGTDPWVMCNMVQLLGRVGMGHLWRGELLLGAAGLPKSRAPGEISSDSRI